MLEVLYILGALASIVALAWAFYVWWARRIRVDVSIREPADRYSSVAIMMVRNLSDVPVQVVTAGFDLPNAPRQEANKPMVYQLLGDGGSFDPVGATYPPVIINPGASWTTLIDRSLLEDLLGRAPTVTAWVCTGDKKEFTSKPTELFGKRWKQQIAELDETDRRLRHGPLG